MNLHVALSFCYHVLSVVSTDRFIFSDDYIKAVGLDLALNILCAVTNPLGAEGMLRIVRGCLNSRNLRKDLSSVMVPLILIQVKYTYQTILTKTCILAGCRSSFIVMRRMLPLGRLRSREFQQIFRVTVPPSANRIFQCFLNGVFFHAFFHQIARRFL